MVKLNKLDRKAQELSIELLVKILIALLVLVSIFYILFGNYIWDYVRGLPGYKYDNKDKVVSNISKDDLILVSYYRVAVLSGGRDIKLCTNNDCSNLRNSNLYVKGDERQGIIYTDINWALDKKIGVLMNNRIIIDSLILEGKGNYEKVKNQLTSYFDLKNLDNSVYISGTFYRDKEYVVGDDEARFGTKVTYLKKDDDSFGEKAKNLEDGNVMIVYLEYSFGKIKTSEIQIERYGNEFKIFITYLDSSGKEESTLLDCYTGWGKYIPLKNVKETLTETLKNNCGL